MLLGLMGNKMLNIYGLTVDNQTRCKHYHSPLDIIAIKFKCCDKFYPCYQCHQHCEQHKIERWQIHEFDQQAILCGCCKNTLSIHQYMAVKSCPHCQSAFNPSCKKHYHLYFDVEQAIDFC